jgi:hypothetical protein
VYAVNAVKCVLTFGMPAVYQVCNVDVVSVLWNWFCFI